MKINWSKVNQLINKTCIWGRYNGFEYVSNSYFMIRTKEIPTSTMNKLLGIFNKLPEENGDFLILRDGNISTSNNEFKNILDKYDPENLVIDTNLLGTFTEKDKGFTYKIFIYKSESYREDRYYYINIKYFEIIKEFEGDLKASSNLNPIKIQEDDIGVIILPIKLSETNSNLKELTNR